MTKPNDEYYERAAGWGATRQMTNDRSRRIAWIVATVAVGVIVLQAIGLILLTPLKTVEPLTLLVDKQTGYVQALKPLTPMRVGADAALTQSFLVQYVVARESFDRATLKQDYRKVALWSAGRARSGYLAGIVATNPASPLNRYAQGTVVSATVKSVTMLASGVAQVRFDTQREDRDGGDAPDRAWVAILRYRFSDAPMAMEDRYINPLGFQVLSYRRAAEVLPAVRDPDIEAAPAPARARPVPATARLSAGQPDTMAIMPVRQVPLGSPLDGHMR